MREAGYGAPARLAFDLAVIGFANRFDEVRQETVERPAPDHKGRKPTMQVPKHSQRDLLRMLGIEDEWTPGAAAAAEVTDSDWDGLWGEAEGGEGG